MTGFLVSVFMGVFGGYILSFIVEEYFDRKAETVSRFTKNIVSISYTILVTIIIYYGTTLYFIGYNQPIGLHWIIIGSFFGHVTMIFFLFGAKKKNISIANHVL